jgi:hypothetical protein
LAWSLVDGSHGKYHQRCSVCFGCFISIIVGMPSRRLPHCPMLHTRLTENKHQKGRQVNAHAVCTLVSLNNAKRGLNKLRLNTTSTSV